MGEKNSLSLDRLYRLVKRLRAPDGCPWDRAQKKGDLGRYLLNEAYEVKDAIEAGGAAALQEELGDLLFQIVFLSVMAEEEGEFTLEGVLSQVEDKMIRRHPHVFGDVDLQGVEEVKKNWELIKAKEGKSILNGVPKSLPALCRAQEVTRRAARVGFDWPDVKGVWEKIEEELRELRQAMGELDERRLQAEMGDLLFTCVNLARFLKVEAEEALNESTKRFLTRFSYLEEKLKERGKSLEEATGEEMDALWEEAKKR
ncbi:MAG TPA: nucleoside triphosphate pyrophosphohydrolase [Syntrophales bacterium]|nr:nucleoside triphosphate pyrophosphohydrolase [Syntrophales bacterium]HOL60064.1 nucleoside triphosphate pyrophosphohydrolase [Syntrophales bacterium]HPO36174.1 nucleoside triphosphate pyrophosphohydrolase [Syntrophales bacterium]